jgi:hypothetical protein
MKYQNKFKKLAVKLPQEQETPEPLLISKPCPYEYM